MNLLLPDAGSLITLAYADALDLLLKPGWSVQLVDMVLHEVTRIQTPSSEKIEQWASQHALPVLPTRTFEHYQKIQASGISLSRKSNLGELAIQEVMNGFALSSSPVT